jgi:hypothetical protein
VSCLGSVDRASGHRCARAGRGRDLIAPLCVIPEGAGTVNPYDEDRPWCCVPFPLDRRAAVSPPTGSTVERPQRSEDERPWGSSRAEAGWKRRRDGCLSMASFRQVVGWWQLHRQQPLAVGSPRLGCRSSLRRADVAGALLTAAGDNPGRLRNQRAFARLCGAAPLEASSGRTRRHRLNRGGDRQANNALWRIVLVRMHYARGPRPTSPAAPPKDCPSARSSAGPTSEVGSASLSDIDVVVVAVALLAGSTPATLSRQSVQIL